MTPQEQEGYIWEHEAQPAAPDSPRDLIAELRGGAPEACDWCGKTSEQLEPVSGDQWVCHHHGEYNCPGCDDCESDRDDDYDDYEY